MRIFDGEKDVNYTAGHGFAGYRYTWTINGQDSFSPAEIMSYFKDNPGLIFPFPIKDSNSEYAQIRKGRIYFVSPLLFRQEPVEVIDETDTSFTFSSLAGHIHGIGALLRFSIARESTQTELRQEAVFRKRWFSQAARIYGASVWWLQAQRLSGAKIPVSSSSLIYGG